jgi:hypothetical protein
VPQRRWEITVAKAPAAAQCDAQGLGIEPDDLFLNERTTALSGVRSF